MKKRLFLITVLILSLAFTVTPVSANRTDVKVSDVVDIDDHWAEKQMTHLVGMGIVKGYATNYYDPVTGQWVPGKELKPNTKITRAEFAVMMYQALNLPTIDGYAPFKDRKDIPWWAEEAVYSLYNQGIMMGDSKGYVKPNANIKRAEIAAMIVKGLHDQTPVKQTRNFPDVASRYWFYNQVQKAADMGIVSGKPDGSFAPNSYATRGEVMTMLYNMMAKDRVDVPSDEDLLAVTDEYVSKSSEIIMAGAPYDLTPLTDLLTGSEAAALGVNNDALNELAEVGEVQYEVLSEGKVEYKSDWLAAVKYDTRFTYETKDKKYSFELEEVFNLMKVNDQWLIYYIPSKE